MDTTCFFCLVIDYYIYLVYIDTFRTQIIIPTILLCFIDMINTYWYSMV